MAINKINEGLKIVKLDSNNFNWTTGNKAYAYSVNNAKTVSHLSQIITFYVVSEEASGILFGLNISWNNTIRVHAIKAATGDPILTESEIPKEAFTVYAIGY